MIKTHSGTQCQCSAQTAKLLFSVKEWRTIKNERREKTENKEHKENTTDEKKQKKSLTKHKEND